MNCHVKIKDRFTFNVFNKQMVSNEVQTTQSRPRVVSMEEVQKEIFTDFQRDFSTCSSEEKSKQTDNLYTKYAQSYENGMKAINYKDPEILANFVANSNLLHPQESQVCDFGSGTGLLGQELHKLGFINMHALDGNQEMLE